MGIANIKRLFYTFAFFDEFILIYPLYAVMFADRGLSPAQISSLFIVWSLTSFLLEVPSGAVADKYSRKYVLIAGVLLRAGSFAFWLFMPDYTGFLLGFILWGIGTSLESGTKEALVYDELKRTGGSKEYTKLIGRMEMLGLLATVAAGVGAAVLAPYGYAIILACSIAGVFVAAFVLWLLPKAQAVESTAEVKYWHYVSQGVKVVLRNRKVLFTVAFLAIVTGLGATDEYYNLLFQEQGMSTAQIAFWTGAVFAFGALGGVVAHRFEGKKFPLTLSLLVWGGLLYASTLLPATLSPLAIGLFVGFVYLIKVLFNTYLQQGVDDATRATATSVNGFLSELGALVVFAMFAVVAQNQGYAPAFQITAGIIVCAGLLYGALRRRYGIKG